MTDNEKGSRQDGEHSLHSLKPCWYHNYRGAIWKRGKSSTSLIYIVSNLFMNRTGFFNSLISEHEDKPTLKYNPSSSVKHNEWEKYAILVLLIIIISQVGLLENNYYYWLFSAKIIHSYYLYCFHAKELHRCSEIARKFQLTKYLMSHCQGKDRICNIITNFDS